MARDDLDLALSFQQSDVTFPDSGYGLEKDRSTSINIDANFQLSTEQQIYGYVSRQSGRKGVRANSGTNAAGASNTCAFTTGAALTTQQVIEQCAQQVWLAAAAWNMDTADRSDVFGLGLQRDFDRVQFAFDYTYSFSRTSITYDYGANVLTPAQAVLAGSAFPDMTLIQHTLSAHLVVPVTKQAAVHLVYRHESGRVTDWHYTGVPIGASAAENNATLMLDAGPQNYHTNVIGVLFQARL
jgi:hypothetical protein